MIERTHCRCSVDPHPSPSGLGKAGVMASSGAPGPLLHPEWARWSP